MFQIQNGVRIYLFGTFEFGKFEIVLNFGFRY